jgi:hypothetical protein
MTVLRAVLALTLSASFASAQTSGKAAYEAFATWRTAAAVGDWDTAIARYRTKLTSDGLTAPAIERALQAIEAYDEGVWYDKTYAAAPTFNTEPNRLLAEAVKGRPPGAALDVAMAKAATRSSSPLRDGRSPASTSPPSVCRPPNDRPKPEESPSRPFTPPTRTSISANPVGT